MSDTIRQSRFYRPLSRHYRHVPSILLCRVPELEYAAELSLGSAALDHCCGDGRFAGLAWPGQSFAAGCDLDEPALAQARHRGGHRRLDACDAAKRLPYEDGAFEFVFNNSALEHIPDLDAALAEIARVLQPGGRFAFNVLNHRYFDWWPSEAPRAADYREWQPFFHALDLAEWTRRLAAVGLQVEETRGYFGEEAARLLALLDSEFSGDFFGRVQSELVRDFKSSWWTRRRWRQRIEVLPWRTAPDAGAGYFFQCRKR